jgi:hypothetical protein
MRALLVLGCVAVLAGCGSSDKGYTAAEVKAAYFRPADFGQPTVSGGFVDPDFHSHSNYVPIGGLEICPLAQRSEAASGNGVNEIEPKAAQPIQQYIVDPKSADDLRTPTITQGGLVFGTATIASDGMDAATAAMTKCPSSYTVNGGPAPILGTYSVSMRPIKLDGWSGVSQQIAHTFPTAIDNVYYEDLTHIVVQRSNVILYVDVTHQKIIGERADSGATAQTVLKTVLKRLG